MLAELLMARDTVWCETPAKRATSAITGAFMGGAAELVTTDASSWFCFFV
jgi:hypothetical protein